MPSNVPPISMPLSREFASYGGCQWCGDIYCRKGPDGGATTTVFCDGCGARHLLMPGRLQFVSQDKLSWDSPDNASVWSGWSRATERSCPGVVPPPREQNRPIPVLPLSSTLIKRAKKLEPRTILDLLDEDWACEDSYRFGVRSGYVLGRDDARKQRTSHVASELDSPMDGWCFAFAIVALAALVGFFVYQLVEANF